MIAVRRNRCAASAIAAVLASLLLASSAAAEVNTFTVNSTFDPTLGGAGCTTAPGGCTLRAAIIAANDGDTTDQDRIHIAVGGLTPAQRTITLARSLPTIDEPLAIDSVGLGNPIISGNDAVRPFKIDTAPGDDVSIAGVLITAGRTSAAGQHGGAIDSQDADLTLLNSAITSSVSTESGGGIHATSGSVAIEGSTVSGNTADGSGGGIAITDAALAVRRSTISGNRTVELGSPGGGIYSGASTIESSTISGNRVQGSGSSGGGLRVGAATIRNSTVVANRTEGPTGRGGGIIAGNGDPTLVNTIVADNTILGGGAASDLDSGSAGDVHELAYTLVETTPHGDDYDETTPGSNVLGADPMLGALASNSGPTFTHLPMPGSPVLDQGLTDESTDQRGLGRPRGFRTAADAAGGDGADIGAVEVQIAPPTFIGTTPASPSGDDSPEVRGQIPSGVPEIDNEEPLVVLYTAAGCPLSSPTGNSQSPSVFSDPGITVGPLPHDATTTIYGTTLSDYGGSECSSGPFPNSIAYTHADPVTPPSVTPPRSDVTAPVGGVTGEREAALKRCKQRKRRLQRADLPWKKKHKNCRRRALALPV